METGGTIFSVVKRQGEHDSNDTGSIKEMLADRAGVERGTLSEDSDRKERRLKQIMGAKIPEGLLYSRKSERMRSHIQMCSSTEQKTQQATHWRGKSELTEV